MAQQLLFGVFLSALFIQLIYYWGIFSRLAFYKDSSVPNPGKNRDEPVSVIICARNESKNLRKNLYSVLQQSYPKFQVIVVNDCSFDDTGDFLKQMEKEYSHLKIVTIPEQEKYEHGKKFALTLGIKAAQHDLLLFTDADCMPTSKNWLANMQSRFHRGFQQKEIVLGYGAYEKKKGLLNKLIRFDTFYTALQYLSFSLIGKTYMGVGRNLAYRKSLFFRNKGFASHYDLVSGDDDLFINETANNKNASIEISSESFTYSEPRKNFKHWFNQKRRHTTTGMRYKLKFKFMLGLLFISHFLFYASLISLLAIQFDFKILLLLFSIRLLTQLIIWGMSMKKLKEWDLWLLSPILDFFTVIFYLTLAVSNLFFRVNKWI